MAENAPDLLFRFLALLFEDVSELEQDAMLQAIAAEVLRIRKMRASGASTFLDLSTASDR
jgi:hypothetical protein